MVTVAHRFQAQLLPYPQVQSFHPNANVYLKSVEAFHFQLALSHWSTSIEISEERRRVSRLEEQSGKYCTNSVF